jgi:hypothetical protein
MKHLILFSCFTLAVVQLTAQCSSGQASIIINISPDSYPSEIHWSVRDVATNALIDTGNANSDTLCLAPGSCVRFTIFDDFGDGIYSPGFYELILNGTTVVRGGQNYRNSIEHYLNCPPGTSCADPITISSTGVYSASRSDTWYRFIADSTGNYRFSTCSGNSCDTRIYGYENCVGIQFDDAVLGVVFYNDNHCGLQSEANHGLAAGDTVWVRIGDAGSACGLSPIAWSIAYTGPITGCMDPSACNYNPLAIVSDNNCVYSGPLCQGPDLLPDSLYLVNTLAINNNHTAQTCEVQEGCIQGYGTRQLLYFGVQIWNRGTQPYWPGTAANNPNAYEYAPCHGHYHYKGFANAYLYDANFNQVDFARKTSYAIINMTCQSPTSDPPLAAGCSDIYGAGYACQWVDVTDLDPGLYHLVLRINPDGLPDQAGRLEQRLDNNSTQVCVNLIEDANGFKDFTIESNCPVFTDCMGIPFGNTPTDCEGNCNGSLLRGDLNRDNILNTVDVDMYLQQITQGNILNSPCNDLTGDSQYTVYDAARLNACLRSRDSTHVHIGGQSGNHSHCNFPFAISNQFDTVSIGLSNITENTVDITLKNPSCYLMGAEFYINGLLIDSVKPISQVVSMEVQSTAAGHISMLSKNELAINKLYNPTPVLRAFYSSRTDSVICVEEVVDAVNSNYEKVMGITGACVEYNAPVSAVKEELRQVKLQIFPNPSKDRFQIALQGALLQGVKYRLLNSLGLMMQEGMVESSNNRFDLSLAGYPNGIYQLQLEGINIQTAARLMLLR